jgi:ribosome hibernation promoting factor
MSITITARHASITEEIKDYARERINSLYQLGDPDEVVHLIIDTERGGYVLELNLQAGHNHINCRAQDRNIQTAINQVAKKFEKQLKKHREKISHRHHDKIQVPYAPEDIPEGIPRLIKVNDYVIEEMGEREASIRIRESNRSFLIYRSRETNTLSVIFRRKDGDLGLLEIDN